MWTRWSLRSCTAAQMSTVSFESSCCRIRSSAMNVPVLPTPALEKTTTPKILKDGSKHSLSSCDTFAKHQISRVRGRLFKWHLWDFRNLFRKKERKPMVEVFSLLPLLLSLSYTERPHLTVTSKPLLSKDEPVGLILKDQWACALWKGRVRQGIPKTPPGETLGSGVWRQEVGRGNLTCHFYRRHLTCCSTWYIGRHRWGHVRYMAQWI